MTDSTTLYGKSAKPHVPPQPVTPQVITAFAVVSVTLKDIMDQVRGPKGELAPPVMFHTTADLEGIIHSLPKWDLKHQLAVLAKLGPAGFTDEDKRLITVYSAVSETPMLATLMLLDAKTAGYLAAWYAWDEARVTPESMLHYTGAHQVNVAIHLQVFDGVVAEMVSDYIKPSSPLAHLQLAIPHVYVPLLLARRPDLKHKIEQVYPSEHAVKLVKECISAFAALNKMRIHSSWIVDSAATSRLIHCLQNDYRHHHQEQ